MQRPDNHQGVFTSIEELVALRAQAGSLNLQKKQRALAQMAGLRSSPFRGRGMDFEEVRLYQPGDDVRAIDWRVTARTDVPHTKLYQEERERPVFFIVDQRASLFFGSRVVMKSVLAARLCALLAWGCHNQGDRIGGLIFGNSEHHELRPKDGRNGVLHFLQVLNGMNQQVQSDNLPDISLAHVLTAARRVIRPGSLVFLISDFYDFDEAAQQALIPLSKHNEILAQWVYDPLEKELPPPGDYRFSANHQQLTINTANSKARQHFTQQFQKRFDTTQHQLNRLGIPLMPIATGDDLTPLLREQLGLSPVKRNA